MPSHAIKTRRRRSNPSSSCPNTPRSQDKGRTLDLPSSLELGQGEVHLSTTRLVTSTDHSYPGGTPVLRIQDNTPFECRQTYLIPVLLHDCCFIDKIECKIYTKADPKHANYINYAWLYFPKHAHIYNTNTPHTHSSSLPNADCKFLLISVGGTGSTCSFLQWSCFTLASM